VREEQSRELHLHLDLHLNRSFKAITRLTVKCVEMADCVTSSWNWNKNKNPETISRPSIRLKESLQPMKTFRTSPTCYVLFTEKLSDQKRNQSLPYFLSISTQGNQFSTKFLVSLDSRDFSG
jgi:hypothetical protein